MTALVATFAGAVVLHALWDSFDNIFDNIFVYAVLGVISLTWLLLQLRRYRTFEAYAPVRTPAPQPARA